MPPQENPTSNPPDLVEDQKDLVEDEKGLYSINKLPQDDPTVQYRAYSATSGKACGMCRWYRGEGHCWLVECDPLPITAIGNCLRNESVTPPEPEDLLAEFLEDNDIDVSVGVSFSERQKTTLQKLFAKILGIDDTIEASGFKVVDDDHWMGWWTNNFEDRQKQLFSADAIDEYIQRVKSGEIPYPELWYYHIPGTRHGQAEKLWRVGHFGVAYGSFDNTNLGRTFKAHYQSNRKSRGMSHGFFYPENQLVDGVFHKFTTFEVTVLDPHHAANPYTTFKEISDMKALVPDSAKVELETILGKDLASKLLNSAEARGKALESTTRFKSDVDDEPEEGEKSGDQATINDLKSVVTSLATQVVELKAMMEGSDSKDPKDKKKDEKKTVVEPQAGEGEPTMKDVLSALVETQKMIGMYMGLQPRGSAHPNTVLDMRSRVDMSTAEYLAQKQRESVQGESIVQKAVKGNLGFGAAPMWDEPDQVNVPDQAES